MSCLVLLAACSEAPVVRFVPTNRVVLAEFFTFSRCTYCPYAARALDSVAAEYSDSLVVIALHRRVAGDTLSPPYVETRSLLYGEAGGGEPATVFDGGPVIRTAGPEYNYSTFRDQYLGAKSVRPLAQLEVAGGIGAAGCSVVVRATGVDSTPVENVRLFVVILEDGVRSRLPGNSDTIFNHVMRGMLPDENGMPVVLVPADTIQIVMRFAAPPFWNLENLGTVVFVQDMTTRKILQTVRQKRF